MNDASNQARGIPKTVFVFFRHTTERIDALNDPSNPLSSYLFQGVDRYKDYGWLPDCNLRTLPGHLMRRIGNSVSRTLMFFGGYGGDFATVLRCCKRANAATLVYSTVDTVGIPLALFRWLGLIRKPVVYMSIGLCERLDRMRDGFMKRVQIASIRRCAVVAGYGFEEVRRLKAILGPEATVRFIPYYVDTAHWTPDDRPATVDVLSFGIDTMRDFQLLADFARRNPNRQIKIITNDGHLADLAAMPANVVCARTVPWSALKHEIAAARLIALPLKENTYSGATTSLLQCMAMGKPVVVSRVGAIAGGYGLEDGIHCRFVPPGDADQFADALEDLLAQPRHAAAIGQHARAHVCQTLDASNYLKSVIRIFNEAT